MTRTMLGATGAAVLLSAALVGAQTPQGGREPDNPLPNRDAAKSAQTTTITGCVVRDAANGGRATISSKGTSYELTGKRDAELSPYLGKRVEVRGTLDSGSSDARATSGTSAPPDQTATAGQKDVPSTDAPRDNTTVPLKTDKGTTADNTSRLHVTTIRIVAPNCLQQ